MDVTRIVWLLSRERCALAVSLIGGSGGNDSLVAGPILVLVDSDSLPFVRGSQIDFEESLQGAGFKVNNPNVVAACGCGSSFRVAEEEQVSAV